MWSAYAQVKLKKKKTQDFSQEMLQRKQFF